MSLWMHIMEGKRSPVGRLLLERFSHTRNITTDANRQLQDASIIRPASPLTPHIYMTLGTAMDYRIRYAFAITPSEQLVAWEGAWSLALKPMESDDDIPIEGDEFDALTHVGGIPFFDSPAHGSYSWRLIRSFFDGLDTTLAEIKPTGRRLELSQEQRLARFCYVLALFEQEWRIGLDAVGPLFEPAPKVSVQELLAIPQNESIDDLCAMSSLFYDQYKDLLSKPVVLNPTFQGSGDVGGADADLIVDGCLIELKTSLSSKMKTDWLRQLVGYLLLDYEDTYKITALGLYMVRQGILFTWPVKDFLQKLTGDPLVSVEALREEFRALFSKKRAKAKQNAHPGIVSSTALHNHQIGLTSLPPAPEFKAGEKVRHHAFGDGVVLGTKPMGINDQEVTVMFERMGKKRLLASMARLERI